MKNTTIKLLIAGAMLAIGGCSKSDGPSSGPSGFSSAFSTLFPHIDTATLWSEPVRKGATAKIAEDGSMIISGIDSFTGGSYVIQLTDSSSGFGRKTFNLLRAGVDTIISASCGIGIDSTPMGRKYYWMLIDGGNLPTKAIVRGVFVDSI